MPNCEFCNYTFEVSELDGHIETEHPENESHNNQLLVQAKLEDCPKCRNWKSTDAINIRNTHICSIHNFIGDFNHDF
tara:strand:+ start:1295 stop:1525 length:231 start_codon:yes stop_codon:yes gene_type:complete